MNRIIMMHGRGGFGMTRQLTLRFLDCQVSRDVIAAVGRWTPNPQSLVLKGLCS